MTAPTQGKELGAASATRGTFPPACSPFPCSLLHAARSARPRAARPGERGPPLRGPRAGRPLPARGSCRLTRPGPCSPDPACWPAGAWLLWDVGAPGLGVGWTGKRRTPSQGSRPLFGCPGVWGPLPARLPGCVLPGTPVPRPVSGPWRGWLVAPGAVPGTEGGRDPAGQGSGSWKTHFG